MSILDKLPTLIPVSFKIACYSPLMAHKDSIPRFQAAAFQLNGFAKFIPIQIHISLVTNLCIVISLVQTPGQPSDEVG